MSHRDFESLLRPNLRELPTQWLTGCNIAETLYEAEYPVVFTVETSIGLLLAYVAAESTTGMWQVMAPISGHALDRLKRGTLALRAALTASSMWLVLVENGTVRKGFIVEERDIPHGHLPLPMTPLLPEHEPVLTARAVGAEIRAGAVPASVVSFVAEGVRSSLKALMEYSHGERVSGAPRRRFRELYDLPVQELAFGSFQVAFGSPSEMSEEIGKAVQLLREALSWASRNDLPAPGDKEAPWEQIAILRALYQLAPPTRGPIQRLHIGGSWAAGISATLTSTTRLRITHELKKLDDKIELTLVGRIIAFDDERSVLTLRQPHRGPDMRVNLLPSAFDPSRELFTQRTALVVVFGYWQGQKYHATNVVEAPADYDPDRHEPEDWFSDDRHPVADEDYEPPDHDQEAGDDEPPDSEPDSG